MPKVSLEIEMNTLNLRFLGKVFAACMCFDAWAFEVSFISTGDEIACLGLRETVFVQMNTDIQRVIRPVRGPRGELGKWTRVGEHYLGQPFESTYFVENGRVSRVEKVWTTNAPACGDSKWFETTIEQLDHIHGSGQVFGFDQSSDLGRRSAIWNAQDTQISLFASLAPDKCSMRLVLKPKLIKDGSEL